MRPSRWITFPLLMGVLLALPAVIFRNDSWPLELLFRFIIGIAIGFGCQAWSDYRTRQRAGSEDLSEDHYSVRQSGSVTVFGDRDSVLDLCVKAIEDLGNVRIKKLDREKGEITGRTKMNWESFGTLITLRVAEVGDNLAEVTISTRPIPRTAVVDYGYGLEAVRNITQFLKKNDRSVNTDLLMDGAEILVAATKRPLAKEFDRRMTGSSD
jgi:hypothetical protein